MLTLVLALSLCQPPGITRTQDVIYGRKHGTALTLDVFTPAKPNGRGVIAVVSGGWFSAHANVNGPAYLPLLARGYTVFAVVHGSQPKYTIPEVLDDLHRAVRFVKASAGKYAIDPDKLGITGASAGGHLSLMQGTAGQPGNPKAADPVDRQASGVAAVACFFPPTDFLNWGEPGKAFLGDGPHDGMYRPAFEFWERDKKTNALVVLADPERRMEIGRQISPITHASAKSAPTLIAHGDKDELVPLQQAEVFVAKLKAAGVPAELVVKPGAAHGWQGMGQEVERFADWFDAHLLGKAAKPTHTTDSLDTIRKAVTEKAAVLIDVREPAEWDAGHLADAVNLPLSRIQDGVPADELARLVPAGKRVYLHCGRGGRCLTAAELLARWPGRDLRPLKAGYSRPGEGRVAGGGEASDCPRPVLGDGNLTAGDRPPSGSRSPAGRRTPSPGCSCSSYWPWPAGCTTPGTNCGSSTRPTPTGRLSGGGSSNC